LDSRENLTDFLIGRILIFKNQSKFNRILGFGALQSLLPQKAELAAVQELWPRSHWESLQRSLNP